MNISEFCKIYTGTGFPMVFQGKKNGKYPFYKVSDISVSNTQQKIFLGNANNYIDELELSILKGNIIPAGTIVFAKIGEALKLNKRAITSCECLIDNNVIGIKPDENIINLLYFYYYLLNIDMLYYSESTTLPSVRKSTIEKIKVKIPPINVQNKRVTILNLCHKTIKYKMELLHNLELLVKSRFVEMFGNPIINDKKYPVFKLKDISQKIGSGVTPRGGDSNYIDKGVAFIRSMNVYNNTFKKDNLVYIDESLAKQLCQVELFSNDLLLNITGASVARCCTVPDDILPARVNQHVCIIRQCRISNVFLEYCLTNESYQEYLLLLSNKNGATREALTKIQVENLEVIFPPLIEIARFVKIVHQINKLKSDVQKSIDEIQLLMDSLMQEYFG